MILRRCSTRSRVSCNGSASGGRIAPGPSPMMNCLQKKRGAHMTNEQLERIRQLFEQAPEINDDESLPEIHYEGTVEVRTQGHQDVLMLYHVESVDGLDNIYAGYPQRSARKPQTDRERL